MRRGMMLVLVVLLASAAMPQSVEARPRLFKMLGVITNPVGALLGAPRHAGRRSASHRRSHAARTRKAPAAAVAGVAAGTGAAAAAVSKPPAATWETSAANAPPAASPEPGAPQIKAATGATPAPNAVAAPVSSQRTAAVTAQPDEPAAAAPAGPRLGLAGPPAWPSAFEDVIGYALWPKDYAGRLRTHGIGDVLATAFTPGTALAARARPGATSEPKTTIGSGGGESGICQAAAAASSDWPAADIKRSLTLNEAQSGALNELQAAIKNAAGRVRLTCRDEAAPVDRLRTLQNMLWAVHEAAQTVRAPLAKFYDQLSDEQKRQFATPAAAQTEPRTANRQDLMRMCGAPADEMRRHVEQSLHPTPPQRASLDALQKKSFEMGQFLMASCLKPLPATPAERLDAAADRLTAVIFAASNVNMALNEFTSQLSAEQKAKLNALGR